MECCEECKFWNNVKEIKDSKYVNKGVISVTHGQCRRYPPIKTPSKDVFNLEWEYPITDVSMWCGEHRVGKKPY